MDRPICDVGGKEKDVQHVSCACACYSQEGEHFYRKLRTAGGRPASKNNILFSEGASWRSQECFPGFGISPGECRSGLSIVTSLSYSFIIASCFLLVFFLLLAFFLFFVIANPNLVIHSHFSVFLPPPWRKGRPTPRALFFFFSLLHHLTVKYCLGYNCFLQSEIMNVSLIWPGVLYSLNDLDAKTPFMKTVFFSKSLTKGV